MTLALAKELAPYGVRVNCDCAACSDAHDRGIPP